jgi:polysaccharide export outer membrane protein
MLKCLSSLLFTAVLATLLPACSVLPGTGPTSDAVNGNATASVRSTAPLPYALVDITADTIGLLSQPNLITFKGEFPDKRPKPTQVVGVGDVLNISIFEAALAACSRLRRPPALVPATSSICRRRPSIKRAAFMFPTPARFPPPREPFRKFNRPSLPSCTTRAIEPQVVVSLNQQHSSVVSVLGDVNTPGVLALNSAGERLLALIARAGGPKFEAIESYVTLQRDGKRVKVLLSRVVHDPSENIFIRPNDVIFITREAPTFTALGALNQNVFGFNSEIPFDVETLTLMQAIGKAGGLSDIQSDPGQIFVYRHEDRHFLKKLGLDTTRFTFDRIPTIYRLNLRDPSGMLLAAGFQMRSKDVMYVANAKVVDFYKLLTLINNTANATSNVANAVTSTNIAAKTRW